MPVRHLTETPLREVRALAESAERVAVTAAEIEADGSRRSAIQANGRHAACTLPVRRWTSSRARRWKMSPYVNELLPSRFCPRESTPVLPRPAPTKPGLIIDW